MTDKINGFSLNWALGYLINELNRDDFLPYEEPPRLLSFHPFLSLLLTLGFIGSCFLIYVLHKKIRINYKREDIEAQKNSEEAERLNSGRNVIVRKCDEI